MAATDSFSTPTKNCENLQAGFAALQQQAFAQASYKSCSLLVYIAVELLALIQHFLTETQNLHRNQISGLKLRDPEAESCVPAMGDARACASGAHMHATIHPV